ncbi:MAG: hypothetical protein WAW73_20145 [Rhodoferax sp.]
MRSAHRLASHAKRDLFAVPSFDITVMQPLKLDGFELHVRHAQIPTAVAGSNKRAVPWNSSVVKAFQDAPEEHTLHIAVLVKTAFERLKSGSGEPKDFDRLAGALNVGLIRAEAIDPLAEETMLAGIEAMKRCDGIWQRHGRYGFTGPDLTAVADAVQLYEGILSLSKPIQMEAAYKESARRMLAQMQGESV